MSARLTVRVEGTIRWMNVKPGQIVPSTINKLIPEANRLNTQLVPRGKTGKLQGSFKVETMGKSIVVGWDADYAKFVDKGTGESPGRYVPAIGKRLKPMSSRQQIHKFALKAGVPEDIAEAVLHTPIHFITKRYRDWEEYWYPQYIEPAEYPKKQDIMERLYGKVILPREIMKERGKEYEAATIRHELWHSLQVRALGHPTMMKPLPGEEVKIKEGRPSKKYLEKLASGGEATYKELKEYAKGWPEKGAYWAEEMSGKIGKNIGTHPGIKGQHFSTKMADALKPLALQLTHEEIKREFSI